MATNLQEIDEEDLNYSVVNRPAKPTAFPISIAVVATARYMIIDNEEVMDTT